MVCLQRHLLVTPYFRVCRSGCENENLGLKKRKCGRKAGDNISNVFNQRTWDQCPFDGGFVNHDDDDDDIDDDVNDGDDDDDDFMTVLQLE